MDDKHLGLWIWIWAWTLSWTHAELFLHLQQIQNYLQDNLGWRGEQKGGAHVFWLQWSSGRKPTGILMSGLLSKHWDEFRASSSK